MLLNCPLYMNILMPEVGINNVQNSHLFITRNLVSIAQTRCIMLFRGTVVVYFENHNKNILCRRTAVVFSIKINTTHLYGHHCALGKDNILRTNNKKRPRQRRLYSDSPQAGRSGVRNSEGARDFLLAIPAYTELEAQRVSRTIGTRVLPEGGR